MRERKAKKDAPAVVVSRAAARSCELQTHRFLMNFFNLRVFIKEPE